MLVVIPRSQPSTTAATMIQTGAQIAGRPSIGAWVSYGIGSESENLPAFVVLISPGQGGGGQPLYDRLWGSGFLPSQYQGVKFRSVGDPVLYLSNPPGFAAVLSISGGTAPIRISFAIRPLP